jgi:hypothetical protein
MIENFDAFLQDFGVTAIDNNSNSFLVLFDQFHSRMDIGMEGRSLIATAKSEDVINLNLNHGSELEIEDNTYKIVGIRPLDDGKFTELDLKE